MIKQPNEMEFTDKKFTMILYGSPGVGKTTLALSAPDPILIDFDKGISRVKAQHRKTTIFCNTYEDVLSDIKTPEIRDCQTIIIDTGGSFITYLKDWAMRTNPAARQKNGDFNSLKGFGIVKQEFISFSNMVRDTMNKNVIYIFHSDEKADKDGNPVQRLVCEGAAKNIVWQPCDFGGYVQMIGNKRVVDFTPTQEFFAKGCYGIEGQFAVPTLAPTEKNDFLTKLFDTAKANIAAESEAFAPQKEQYDAVMAEVNAIVANIATLEDANAAAVSIPAMEHALTSKKEASGLLAAKVKQLGFAWNKTSKSYIEANSETKESGAE